MTRHEAIMAFSAFLAALALAYFALMAARPVPLARVLLRRGYESRGWNEARLSLRVRIVGIAGAVVAVAAILLAIVKFVG
jgi:hypothetical protein